MTMPRMCHALLVVIVVLAGLAVRQLFFPAAFAGESGGSTGDRDTALAFYAALNGALDGGSTDTLEALLSSVFVDHDQDSGESRSAADFLAEVRALGTDARGMRMEVISVESSGANLMVSIRQTQAGPMRAVGLVVEQPPAAPHVEMLRVARGSIVDRWSPGIRQAQVSEIDGIVLHNPGQTDLSITLERVVIPARVVQRWYAVGPRFVAIESGSAFLSIGHYVREGETLTLEEGDAVDVGQANPARLRSANGEPVTVLEYSIFRRSSAEFQVPAGAQPVTNEGVTRSTLWRGPVLSADAGAEHRLAALAVPAGGDVRISGATNAAVLLAIDRGVIEIGAPEGSVAMLGEDLWPAEGFEAASIDADRAAFLTEAGEITLRNVSQQDVTIVLVIIRAEPEGGPTIG